MKEIALKMDQLIEVINQNSVPTWITIVGILIPIILSLLLLLQSHKQNKKHIQLQRQIEQNSEKMQKELSQHEERVQMRSDILRIYDDFCFAQNVLASACGRIHIIFSNPNSYNAPNMPTQWMDDFNHAVSTICQAVNRAKLLLPSADEDFKKVLENIYEKYKVVRDKAVFYYNSGYAYSTLEMAWNTIASYGIMRNDYYTLMNNRPVYGNFLKLCANESTDEIEQLIKDLLSLFEYDKFDKYFEPYLQMSSIESTLTTQ